MAENRFVDTVAEILEDLENVEDPEILGLARFSLEDLRSELSVLSETIREDRNSLKIFIRRIFIERAEERLNEVEARALKNLLDALGEHRESESFELTIVGGQYFYIWSILFCFRDNSNGLRDEIDAFLLNANAYLLHLKQFDTKPQDQWSSLRLIYLSVIRVCFALYRKPVSNDMLDEFLNRMVQLAVAYYAEIRLLAVDYLAGIEGIGEDPLVRLDIELEVPDTLSSLLKILKGDFEEAAAWRDEPWMPLWRGRQPEQPDGPPDVFGQEYSTTLALLKDRIRLHAKLALGVYSSSEVGGLVSHLGNEDCNYHIVELDCFSRGVLVINHRQITTSISSVTSPLAPDSPPMLQCKPVVNLHVIFRGTNGLFALADWGINLLAIPVVGCIMHEGRVLLEGNMHLGFQWRAQAIVTRIIGQIEDIITEETENWPSNPGMRPSLSITICGHSQGAALSTLVAMCLASYYGDSLHSAIQLETYANPGAFFSYGGTTCVLRCCPGLNTVWAPCPHPWCTYCQVHPSSPSHILDAYPIRHVNHDIDVDIVPRAARVASLVNTAHVTNTYPFRVVYNHHRRAAVFAPLISAHAPENYQTLAHKIVASEDPFSTVVRLRRLLFPDGDQT